MLPHLEHTDILMVVVIRSGEVYAGIGESQKGQKRYNSHRAIAYYYMS